MSRKVIKDVAGDICIDLNVTVRQGADVPTHYPLSSPYPRQDLYSQDPCKQNEPQ